MNCFFYIFYSRSQVCQKYKLQIACFGFLYLQFKHCMAAAYIKRTMLCVICVTLKCGQGINTFFMRQVSGPVRKFYIGIYSHNINLRNVKLRMMVLLTTYRALRIHTTFSNLHHISRSWQSQTALM